MLEHRSKASRLLGAGTLLSTTAWAALSWTAPAMAACDITSAPNTVSCAANTTTTNTSNADAATSPSNDAAQTFSAGGSVTGNVANGVTVNGYGLTVQTSENGAGIRFTNNGAVNSSSFGSTAATLGLITTTGGITYNSAAGATVTGADIISLMLSAQSAGATRDLTAHVNGNVSNTGSIGAATGVALQSQAPGNLLLDGTGNISGGTGISVATPNVNSGSANITVSGSGNLSYTSTSGYGILIDQGNNTGFVTVNRTGTITGPGPTGGNNLGIDVRSQGAGPINITGVGAISGVRFGIMVNGYGDITIAPGANINASFSGISAFQSGAGATSVTSGFNITSTGGSGITTEGFGSGSQTVTVTGGTVSGTSSAVSLYGFSTGGLIFNMSGGTLLSSTDLGFGGLFLDQQTTGNVTVRQTGGSIGLAANPIVGTGILVLTAGNIDVTTAAVYASQVAIRTIAGGNGSVTIVNNGVVRSTGDDAIVSTANSGATTITNHGSLLGSGSDPVVVAGSAASTISIDNAAGGVITSTLAAPETRQAIFTSGGASTITNSGSLYGLMSLGNGANSVTNSGTWTTRGANAFGSGATMISNTGLLYAGNGTSFGGGALTFNSTGTFAPTGTVTVNGHLGLGGVYQINLASSGADKTVVNGSATLNGGLVRAVQLGAGFAVGQSLVILTATGGVNGTFGGLNLAGAIKAHLGYDSNDAYIVIDQVALAGSLVNGTINQRNVASGIDAALNGGAPAGGFAPILSLTGPALASALDNLSGEVSTGAATTAFQSMNGFVSLLTNTSHSAFGVQAATGGPIGFAEEARLPPAFASAYAATSPARASNDSRSVLDQRWGVWGASYGSAGKVNGESIVLGSHDVSPRAYGVVAGADYRAGADTVLGFAMAGGGTNWGLSNNLGTGRSDVFQLGAYGTHKVGAAYLSGALAYAWNGVNTNRTINLAGIDQLNARFNGQTFAGRMEAGYRLTTNLLGVTPYAAFQAQSFVTPAYGESVASGTGAFALAYDSRSTAMVRTELGSRFDKTFAFGAAATLALRSQLAWLHDSNTDRAMSAVFQTLPGSAFTVFGAAAPKDSALISSGAELRFVNNVTLGARVSGELAGGARSVSAQGSLRYAW